jgi:hypothetical protein
MSRTSARAGSTPPQRQAGRNGRRRRTGKPAPPEALDQLIQARERTGYDVVRRWLQRLAGGETGAWTIPADDGPT